MNRSKLNLRWTVPLVVLAIAGYLLADIWFEVNYQLSANIALLILAVVVNIFTVLYGIRSHWQSNRIGRIFFTKCVFLSMVLDQIVVAIWWDLEYMGRQHVRFVIYALGAIAYIYMLVSLAQHQRQDRKELEDAEVNTAPR